MSRTVSRSIDVVAFPAPAPFASRRYVPSSAPQMTCMVLIRHGQTDKAIKVSCTGDSRDAVWIPKVMVSIEMPSERGVLVASMSIGFAQQKKLQSRFIDPSIFNVATAEVLRDAQARAARKRNAYRGYSGPTPNCMNRNAFA